MARSTTLTRREVFVKVRSTRPPQPAWLTAGRNGIEIELAGGEEGVAPGQACVFYDAADGEARVLGGGFIRATEPAPTGGCARAEHGWNADDHAQTKRKRHDRS